MIAFCLGVALVAILPSLSVSYAAICVLLGGVCVLQLFPTVSAPLSTIPAPRVLSACLQKIMLGAVLGLLWGLAFAHWGLSHRLADDWQGVDLEVSGQVVGLPNYSAGLCQFLFAVEAVSAADEGRRALSVRTFTPRQLKLNHYQCKQPYEVGQRLMLVVRLKQPHGYANPGGFDQERHYFSQGIDAKGYVRAVIDRSEARRWSIDRWRADISDWLGRAVEFNSESEPESKPKAALLQALLVGDKRQLTDQQWQQLRRTGTVHLVVISGLHIGLVCGFVYAGVLLLGRILPQRSLICRQRLAVTLALSAACAYALLAGFTLPTQRALVMACVVMLSLVSNAQASAAKRCGLAAVVVLLLDPLAHFSVGFWLSFLATAALLYLLSAPRQQRPPELGLMQRGVYSGRIWLLGLMGIQIAILLVLTPLLLLNFYAAPVLSPLFNLIAVPVVSFIVLPVAMLGLVAGAVDESLARLLLSAAAEIMYTGLQRGDVWAQGTANMWQPGAPPLWMAISAVLGSLLLCAPRLIPGRWLGTLLWLPLLSHAFSSPTHNFNDGEYRVTVVDVGQGLAVFIATAEHRLLYDTGTFFGTGFSGLSDNDESGFAVAELTVKPYLQALGVNSLDRMVISHADKDHAGGFQAISENFQVDLMMSPAAVGRFTPDLACKAGENWLWDGVSFTVLSPEVAVNQTDNRNNNSCVILVSSPQGRVLLTGDIEASVESRLLRDALAAENLQAEVLIVPHHGSKTSSSLPFIQQVAPDYAVVSAGYRNPYNHPHPDIKARFLAAGIPLLNTADIGAITLDVRDKGLSVSAFRQTQRRYWRY